MGDFEPNKIIPAEENEDSTSALMRKAIDDLVEGLTGIAASEKKEYALTLGHFLQSLTKGNFLKTLSYEWNKYREAGKIKDDYLSTEQHRATLQEMLDFLDEDTPDATRFNFLKRVFLSIATEQIHDRESVLPQQLIKIARSLTSGEVLVLAANHKLVKDDNWRQADTTHYGSGYWLEKIADASNLQYKALVEIHEKTLIEKKLLTPRHYSDRSGIIPGESFRLTDLALQLFKYIEAYDEKVDEAN